MLLWTVTTKTKSILYGKISESLTLQMTLMTLPALRNQAWVWPERQIWRPILSFSGPAEFYRLHSRAAENSVPLAKVAAALLD